MTPDIQEIKATALKERRVIVPSDTILALIEVAEAAKIVMDLLEEHGPSIVPHLLDTDENAGQRLRTALEGVKK